MTAQRMKMGYVEVVTQPACVLFPPNCTVRGHVFHFSEILQVRCARCLLSMLTLGFHSYPCRVLDHALIFAALTELLDKHIRAGTQLTGVPCVQERVVGGFGARDSLGGGVDPQGWEAGYQATLQAPDSQPVREGYSQQRVLASYVHLHFGSRPELATSLVDACRKVRLHD